MAPTGPHHHDDSVPVLRMVLAVAAVVAVVILVFFGVGYGLGRAFV
jgi:preprotein translocase subunit SecE